MKTQKFTLTYPWDKNGYRPKTEYELSADESGFLMKIRVGESDPRREETAHQSKVHMDSCVEWFVNFMPEESDRYFNFETNANGAMHAAFRKNRYDYQLLTEQEIEQMEISASVTENSWKVSYKVPFALIRTYLPQYRFEEGMKVRANFYKCGDKTDLPHYGIWKVFFVEKKDFHRPEFFGEIRLD